MKNEIIVSKTYGIDTLDKAITNVADAVMNANASTKQFALALGALKVEHDKHEVVKTLKFPAWVDSLYSGRCAGQTAYKYAQIAIAFSADTTLWDVLTLSKLSILLNTRKGDCKDAIQASWNFFAWYGDTVNRMQIDRWNVWHDTNGKVLAKVAEFEKVGDAESASLWKERLTKEPKNGIEPPENGLESVEYSNLCAERAFDYLRNVPDTVLSDIVKAYRKPSDYRINEAGKAEKLNVVNTESKSEDAKPKTTDELKADAHSALLAYVSALGDNAPKSLKTALMVLDSKGGDK